MQAKTTKALTPKKAGQTKEQLEKQEQQPVEIKKRMEKFADDEAQKSKEENEQKRKHKEQTTQGMKEEGESAKIRHDPQFLIRIIEEIQKDVAGEEDTIIAVTILATLRLMKDAAPESKNLFLSDTTGVGKDFTTKKILEVVVPEKDLLHVTKMSNEAFTYWHAFEDNWDWDSKVIHLEDITDSLLNVSTFKVMASGGTHSIVVKEQKTLEIPIKGKPCMILTSHHANPEDEALRRFPIGSLNDSVGQTIKIKDKISKKYSGRDQTTPDKILRNTVQQLKAYSVTIPFAELIQFFFPDDILMRTHYRRFLDYIRASAVFHQYQRQKTADGKLIATFDDYMIARMVLIYTTSNTRMIPMSKDYRDILKILQETVGPMTIREIGLNSDKSPDWLYKNLPKLVETKLVKKSKRFDDNANKEVITYQFSPEEKPNAVPTWEEIRNKIEKIINKTNKTTKTPPPSPLEKWFYDNEIKPIKPKNGVFSMVLFGLILPLNREVIEVFAVLGSFLRERDEMRYKRYYEDRPVTTEQTTIASDGNESTPSLEKKSQQQRMQDLKAYLQRDALSSQGASETLLYDKFPASDIDQAMQSKLLIKLPNGKYVWGG